MHIGLIGAGKMGRGLAARWLKGGHQVTVYDNDSTAVAAAVTLGAQTAASIDELVAALEAPRHIWIMLPAGEAVTTTISTLTQKLEAKDILIDGGNSYYKDTITRARKVSQRGIYFVDVGVSGGVAGATTGYALMVGGDEPVIARIRPLLTALQAPDAYAHVGPNGAGHFVKMVHNAIEYGMMQAIAEGFDLLKNGPFSTIAVPEVARLWSHGTIIRSYLVELAAAALTKEQELTAVAPHVEDSGEGRWSVITAVEHAVPFTVNTAALYARFSSRQAKSFSAQLLAALRREFGGHAVKNREETV